MKKRNKILLVSFLLWNIAGAQPYPNNYFSPPLADSILLKGTFGEIRSDHFHSGIDIGTGEKEGKEILAAAEGYVSRIKISAYGFGKALYITHPNGYVTVYAHLKQFNYDIARYVSKAQYVQQTFEIELFPKPKELKVQKGQVIAYSGNTGGSDGPHLHFEIRDERSEEPINPLLFGMPVQRDNIPPVISHLRVFPVTGEGYVAKSDGPMTYMTDGSDGNYTVQTTDFVQIFGKIGFEVLVKDRQNVGGSPLGIYSMQLKVDDGIKYVEKVDRFSFSDTRYANAHIDYAEKIRNSRVFERCFVLPGDHIKIYPDTNLTGFYNFEDEGSHEVEITVSDFSGNKTILKFTLLSYSSLADASSVDIPPDAILILPTKGVAVHKPDVDIVIPSGSLYDNMYFTSTSSTGAGKYFSSIQHVGDKTFPLHYAMTLGIKPVNLPDALKNKAVVVELSAGNKMTAFTSDWKDNFLTSKVRHFGDYAIAVDTVAPEINIVTSLSDGKFAANSSLEIKITDNLSGIKTYRTMMDGNWWLMEYDAKNDLLTGDLSAVIQGKTHTLQLTVTDNVGNVSSIEKSFNY